jgi:hypothetical protein
MSDRGASVKILKGPFGQGRRTVGGAADPTAARRNKTWWAVVRFKPDPLTRTGGERSSDPHRQTTEASGPKARGCDLGSRPFPYDTSGSNLNSRRVRGSSDELSLAGLQSRYDRGIGSETMGPIIRTIEIVDDRVVKILRNKTPVQRLVIADSMWQSSRSLRPCGQSRR